MVALYHKCYILRNLWRGLIFEYAQRASNISPPLADSHTNQLFSAYKRCLATYGVYSRFEPQQELALLSRS